MTMHLEGPWLTTTGRRRGKQKYASAEAKRQAEQLEREWQENQQRWARLSKPVAAPKRETLSYKLSAPVGRETRRVASRDTGHTGAVTTKQIPQYTGTKILGIGTMHKSNAVPIFSDEQAVEISTMRRN
jgi:hypothetical protein